MRGSYINFAKKFQTNRQSPSSASPSGKLSAQRTEEVNYVLFSAPLGGAFLAELLPKGNYGGLLCHVVAVMKGGYIIDS